MSGALKRLCEIAKKFDSEEEALEAAVKIATMQPGATAYLANFGGDKPDHAVYFGRDVEMTGMVFILYNQKTKDLVLRDVSPSMILKM